MAKMKQPNLGKRLTSAQIGGLTSSKDALAEKKQITSLSDYNIQFIPVEKLDPLPFNRQVYEVKDFDLLGATIKQFGLLQPLVVQKKPNEDRYWIIAGERRYHSFLKSCEDGEAPQRYAKGLPCHVFPESMSIFEIKTVVILANATSRPRGPEAQIKELKELIEVFKEAEAENFEIGYSLKELSMSKLAISERQYQKYMSYMSIQPDLAAIVDENNVDIDVAAAIGAKPEEVQDEILERVQQGESVESAYKDVNQQYKEFKKEGKEIDATISGLRAQLAEAKADAEDSDTPEAKKESKQKVQSIKEEIKKQKEKKAAHEGNIREAVKKKEETKESRFEENDAEDENLSPERLDPFSTNVQDAMAYIDKATRALLIHSKEVGPDGIDELKRLRSVIDVVINQADNHSEDNIGDFTV